jgi:hypothetical protein
VARASSSGERFDAVVIVVGLNDLKKAYRGRQFTASAFPYLPHISPISRLYLTYISLYLPCISGERLPQ